MTKSAPVSAALRSVVALTRNIALQYADQGIRANCVLPGLMNTPMIRNQTNPYLANIISEWIMNMYEKMPLESYIDITGDSRNVVAMIKAGLGWGILTESRLESLDQLYLEPIHKPDGTPYRLNTYFVYRADALQYAAYAAYVDHFCEYFTQQRWAGDRSGSR